MKKHRSEEAREEDESVVDGDIVEKNFTKLRKKAQNRKSLPLALVPLISFHSCRMIIIAIIIIG